MASLSLLESPSLSPPHSGSCLAPGLMVSGRLTSRPRDTAVNSDPWRTRGRGGGVQPLETDTCHLLKLQGLPHLSTCRRDPCPCRTGLWAGSHRPHPQLELKPELRDAGSRVPIQDSWHCCPDPLGICSLGTAQDRGCQTPQPGWEKMWVLWGAPQRLGC